MMLAVAPQGRKPSALNHLTMLVAVPQHNFGLDLRINIVSPS
jgi:hypothetical protein